LSFLFLMVVIMVVIFVDIALIIEAGYYSLCINTYSLITVH